jgi:molecular chaperone GrpE (heat shock protein)
MTADADETTALSAIETRLGQLTDLLLKRQRLDREKTRLLEEAQLGPFRQIIHPVVIGLSLVIDRLDRYQGPDPDFAESVREELLDVLERHGVSTVATYGPVDLTRHEVVAVRGQGSPAEPMQVVDVVRRGFQHADWVFRPAQVIVARGSDATSDT